MQERRKQKLNIPFALALVVLFLTLVSTSLTGRLFARYTAAANASDTARVAALGISASLQDKDGNVISPKNISMKTSEDAEYQLVIDGTSEAAMHCDLAGTIYGNLPLKLEFKQGSDAYAEETDDTLSFDIDPNTAAPETWVRVCWLTETDEEDSAEYVGYEYSNGIATVDFSIDLYQVD